MSDLIDRQAAIVAVKDALLAWSYMPEWRDDKIVDAVIGVESATDKNVGTKLSTNLAEVGRDCISRQAAIDALHMHLMYRMGTDSNKKRLDEWINNLPSVQPERTCVNCGRTANNGGWYADGGTRCPIEEHYALPKDGFCHLWEKRNITDDDYPERRADE